MTSVIEVESMCAQVPEHTWGLDVKTFLGDYANWGNPAFHQLLHDGAWNYRCA
jgi:hypothetical protein